MSRQKICVMGSYVTDLTARTPHLPAPGETVLGTQFKMGPGGKGGNQAVAAKRAGGDVFFITKVGKDIFGDLAINCFKEEEIHSLGVFIDAKCVTGTALIAVDDRNENNIIVVPGASAQFTHSDVKQCEPILKTCKFLLVQLEANVDATQEVMQIAKENGTGVILNPAPVQAISPSFISMVDIITPNEVEAEILTGQPVKDEQDCAKAANAFFAKGVKKVVITLGGKGSYCNDGENEMFLPPYPAKVIDTTGAGDAFNGGFVKALADGKDFFEAAAYACVVAGLSVQKFGTAPSTPYQKEIEEALPLYAKQISEAK
ncbi:MAG: ribokinase [Oscillospiraceae bacterium]